jgi:hypothetical protein
MESMGRDTSGMIWLARAHTHTSSNARCGGMPALRRMEARAWQRENGPETWDFDGAEEEEEEEEAAAACGRRVSSEGGCITSCRYSQRQQ